MKQKNQENNKKQKSKEAKITTSALLKPELLKSLETFQVGNLSALCISRDFFSK